jgi:hypothetical protein
MRRFNHWFETLPPALTSGFFLAGMVLTLVLMSYERDTPPWTVGGIVLLLMTMVAACRKLAPYQELGYIRTSCHFMLAFLAAGIIVLIGGLVGM